VFESDVTKSNLGNWVVRKPGDAKYMAGSGQAPIGNDYLEFTGNNQDGGAANSPLVYRFTCPKSGDYRLGMRLLQNLEGAAWDKCNDVYVKLEGDYTAGAACKFPLDILKTDHKFYGRGKDEWGAGINIEGHVATVKTLAPGIYNLKAGVEYTFTMSGRAQRTCIDYIIFYETSISFQIGESIDIAAVNDKKYWPSIEVTPPAQTCSSIKAIDFDKYTGITGFTNAATDNKDGKDILQIATRLANAAAQETYTGADAMVYFTINSMQELDGESTFKLKLNGNLIGQFTNPRIHGTTTPDYTIYSQQINTTPVAIKAGDVIQVEFNNATNGLVPEGTTTATSRGRWYSIDICSESSTSNTPVTGITSLPATLALSINETKTLVTNVTPSSASNKNVTWSSSNTSIATVNASGLVTGKTPGVASIKAKSIDGGFETTCTVTVTNSGNSSQSLSPIHDAYLQGTTLFNTADLRVEAGNRTTYLMFDLASISGKVESAELILGVGSDAGSGLININLGASNNWTETTLSTSNAPLTGVLLGSLNETYALATSYTFTLDASKLSVGGKLSLVVSHVSGNDVSFASKENNNLKPSLKISYSVPTGNTNHLETNNEVKTYPNPFTDALFIDAHQTIQSITIYKLDGTRMYQCNDNTMSKQTIQTNEWPDGMYIIQIWNQDGNVSTKKMIKSR